MNHKYNRKLNESVKEAIRRVVLKENMVAGGNPPGPQLTPPNKWTVPPTIVPGTYPGLPQQQSPITPSFNPDLPPINTPTGSPTPTHPPPSGPNGPLRGRQRTVNGTDYWYPPGSGWPSFYWDPAAGYPPGTGGWVPMML